MGVALALAVPVEAKPRKVKRAPYNPPSAAFVLDVNSGQSLLASNADAVRHPASLTKIMTLYLLFEQLEAGRMKLDTPLEISTFAASQPPSKIGLRPGQTIIVEDAIKALVTKSANDIAVTVAEAVGGNEESFAQQMTRKARALGMTKTVYLNASGLPDDEQITTAREQAILGRAIQERFPRYYRYFATSAFHFNGVSMRNHNKLLGKVHGVDGIKTGYIRASGFNLVTSVRRNNRHVIAVVLGGSSGAARDARMRAIIEQQIVLASAQKTATLAEATRRQPSTEPRTMFSEPVLAAAHSTPVPLPTQSLAALVQTATAAPLPGSLDPIQPLAVKTISVRPRNLATATLTVPSQTSDLSSASSQPRPTGNTASPPPAKPSRVYGKDEWVVQVGAYPEEDKAKQKLKEAQSAVPKLLTISKAFTERVERSDMEMYRARFAGLNKNSAQALCKLLQKSDIACMAMKPE